KPKKEKKEKKKCKYLEVSCFSTDTFFLLIFLIFFYIGWQKSLCAARRCLPLISLLTRLRLLRLSVHPDEESSAPFSVSSPTSADSKSATFKRNVPITPLSQKIKNTDITSPDMW